MLFSQIPPGSIGLWEGYPVVPSLPGPADGLHAIKSPPEGLSYWLVTREFAEKLRAIGALKPLEF